MTRLTKASTVCLLAVLSAALIIVTASRTWMTGSVRDTALGGATAAATGTQSVTGLVALALVGGAGGIAAVTAGRVLRRIVLLLLVAAAGALLWLIGRAITTPDAVLGQVAATSVGRTGTVETTASLSPWPWVALLGGVLLLLSGLLGLAGAHRWRGLSARYEKEATATGARGEKVASDWDRLSAGDDPTDGVDGSPVEDLTSGPQRPDRMTAHPSEPKENA